MQRSRKIKPMIGEKSFNQNKMYKSVLALLMMLGSVTFAQELSGKVVDAETQQGVPGAKVWVRSVGAGVKSDVEGNFRIDFSLPVSHP